MRFSSKWNLFVVWMLSLCRIRQAVPIGCTYSANDKDTCDATTLDSGEACTWCIWKSAEYGFCVSETQAKSMQEDYADITCSNHDDINYHPSLQQHYSLTNDEDDDDDQEDPCTTAASISDDQREICFTTKDASGKSCEWCDLGDYVHVCISSWEAKRAQESGATCETPQQHEVKEQQLRHSKSNSPEVLVDHDNTVQITLETGDQDNNEANGDSLAEIPVKLDTSCLLAMVEGLFQKDMCIYTYDSTGTLCEWCTLSHSFGLVNICLNSEQAQLVQAKGSMRCTKLHPESAAE